MNQFEAWQERECERLGISVDDHNNILDISKRIEAAGGGWPYNFIVSLIDAPKLLELDEWEAQ